MAASTRCLCGFLLLAPDARVGEAVTCTRCGSETRIPEQTEFPCPGCAKPIRTGVDTVGMRIRCPACSRSAFVPEPGPARACPFCQAPLEGRRARCGACGEQLLPAQAKGLAAAWSGPRIRQVEAHRIDPSPFQPRERMDPAALRKLAQSVARFGVLVPLLLRPTGKRFQLVAGARRLEVARRLGLPKVPAVVRTLSDRDAAEIAYLENVQRVDLNPVERAAGLQNIALEEAGVSMEELARRLALSAEEIQEMLASLDVPAYLRKAFASNRITYRQLRALARAARGGGAGIDGQKLLQSVVGASLSEEETESLVRRLLPEGA